MVSHRDGLLDLRNLHSIPYLKEGAMNLKQLTPRHFVSDQLVPEDFAVLAAQGIKSVINNRPDAEAADQPPSNELEQAASLVGIDYVYSPIVTQFLTPEELEENQRALRAMKTPICAFCRTGARAAITWGLHSKDTENKAPIIEIVASAGLPTEALTKQLAHLSESSLET